MKKTSLSLALWLAATSTFLLTGAQVASAQDKPSPSSMGSKRVGKPGNAAQVNRSIEIDMTDNMRFTPERIEVKAGETLRLIVKNAGRIRHELVLGSDAYLQKHDQMMRKYPDMAHKKANAVSLAAGQAPGEIIWQFNQAGTLSFACLEPGHYAAGMKGTIIVS
jgi:uncharacterized cupredoxin-like copper-binding protein